MSALCLPVPPSALALQCPIPSGDQAGRPRQVIARQVPPPPQPASPSSVLHPHSSDNGSIAQ
eukprot:11080573-Prorocentrum_lima.AAC.1